MELSIFIERARGKFWLIPAIAVVLILILFLITIQMKAPAQESFIAAGLFQGYSSDGARLILQSIATAMMTVISVLFSITILVLQQVSAQYSPRVIENFIKAQTSQIMLGLYVGTFVFCLLLLRQIPGDEDGGGNLPQIAITTALGLALLCIVALIHYIHYIADSIRSTTIISDSRDQTLHYLKALISGADEEHAEKRILAPVPEPIVLKATKLGYFQVFHADKIAAHFKASSWILEIDFRPGDYVECGDRLGTLFLSRQADEKLLKKVIGEFEFGDARTHAQDLRYGLRQLVDVSLRALSPSLNDPTTAIEALHAIGSIHMRLAENNYRLRRIFNFREGQLRLAEIGPGEILELSFQQLIEASSDHPFVRDEISRILMKINSSANTPEIQRSVESLQSQCIAKQAQ